MVDASILKERTEDAHTPDIRECHPVSGLNTNAQDGVRGILEECGIKFEVKVNVHFCQPQDPAIVHAAQKAAERLAKRIQAALRYRLERGWWER